MTLLTTFVVLWFANALDAMTFVSMVEAHGISMEANPIVVWLYSHLGLEGLLVFKGAATMLGCIVIKHLIDEGHASGATALTSILVVMPMFGFATNLSTLGA